MLHARFTPKPVKDPSAVPRWNTPFRRHREGLLVGRRVRGQVHRHGCVPKSRGHPKPRSGRSTPTMAIRIGKAVAAWSKPRATPLIEWQSEARSVAFECPDCALHFADVASLKLHRKRVHQLPALPPETIPR